MTDMPREIEIDAKHTVKGYLQVDQWSSKGGLRPPPINGNTRVKYIRADLVRNEDALAAFERLVVASSPFNPEYGFEEAYGGQAGDVLQVRKILGGEV